MKSARREFMASGLRIRAELTGSKLVFRQHYQRKEFTLDLVEAYRIAKRLALGELFVVAPIQIANESQRLTGAAKEPALAREEGSGAAL